MLFFCLAEVLLGFYYVCLLFSWGLTCFLLGFLSACSGRVLISVKWFASKEGRGMMCPKGLHAVVLASVVDTKTNEKPANMYEDIIQNMWKPMHN